MVNIQSTPPKNNPKSKSSSKFLPVFDILTVGYENDFTDLNQAKLIELFKILKEIDPETADHPGNRIPEKEIGRFWKNVFTRSYEKVRNFDQNHELFKDLTILPRNLILKARYGDEKYHARAVMSRNAESIANFFKKPETQKSPDQQEYLETKNDLEKDSKEFIGMKRVDSHEDLEEWFQNVQKSMSYCMETNFKNLQTNIFGKLKDNSSKISRNAENIEAIQESVNKGNSELNELRKEITTLKNDKIFQNEKIGMLELQMNRVLEFKENSGHGPNSSSIGSMVPKELDDYTRAAWFQQNILANRKFSRATTQSENLGFIQVDVQREFTEKLIYKDRDSDQIKFNALNFRDECGVDTEVVRVWQKFSGKYSAILKVKAPLIRRPQMTRELIERRARYKGKFGLSLSVPEDYQIDNFLQFLKTWIDPNTDEPVIIGFDKTKRGFPFVLLNDQTAEKREQFYREKGKEPLDGELSTRVFISCPVEFTKLTQEMLTVDNLKNLANKSHFCFNGGIWKKPDFHVNQKP